MNELLLSGGLSAVYVFLKANQLINVVHMRFRWVMPLSVAMGLCEVAIVLMVVRADSLWLGVMNGLCAGTGATLAMYLHRRKT